jgi:NADH dehydrogenase FAD-containing subunit
MAAEQAARYFEGVAEANPDPCAITPAYKQQDELAYQLSRVPFKTPRPVKIIVVGAGISGISMAHEVNVGSTIKAASLTVYEKNGGVGGTWYENRYPG